MRKIYHSRFKGWVEDKDDATLYAGREYARDAMYGLRSAYGLHIRSHSMVVWSDHPWIFESGDRGDACTRGI